jgi:hypothetical protein
MRSDVEFSTYSIKSLLKSCRFWNVLSFRFFFFGSGILLTYIPKFPSFSFSPYLVLFPSPFFWVVLGFELRVLVPSRQVLYLLGCVSSPISLLLFLIFLFLKERIHFGIILNICFLKKISKNANKH